MPLHKIEKSIILSSLVADVFLCKSFEGISSTSFISVLFNSLYVIVTLSTEQFPWTDLDD